MYFEQIIYVLNNFGAFIVSFGAILIAFFAFRFSRKTYRTNISMELLKEYKSEGMGAAIAYLWNRFYVNSNKNIQTMVNYYIADFQNDPKLKFHLVRRKVSGFFQEMALLYKYRKLDKKIVKSFFLQESLDIIHKIILPLELNALPCCEKEPLIKIPPQLAAMKDFYNEFGRNKINIYKETRKGYKIYLYWKQRKNSTGKIVYYAEKKKRPEKAKYRIEFKSN